MKMFYQPEIGDHVRIKKTKLTGVVLHPGTQVLVEIDNTRINMRIHYRQISPINPGYLNRQKAKKFVNFIIKKLTNLK